MWSDKDFVLYQEHMEGNCPDDCKYCEMEFEIAVEEHYKDVKKEKKAKVGRMGKAIKRA